MPLRITRRKEGGNYYIRGSVAGSNIYASTGTSDRRAAENIRIRTEAQALERASLGRRATATFAEAALNYINSGGKANSHAKADAGKGGANAKAAAKAAAPTKEGPRPCFSDPIERRDRFARSRSRSPRDRPRFAEKRWENAETKARLERLLDRTVEFGMLSCELRDLERSPFSLPGNPPIGADDNGGPAPLPVSVTPGSNMERARGIRSRMLQLRLEVHYDKEELLRLAEV